MFSNSFSMLGALVLGDFGRAGALARAGGAGLHGLRRHREVFAQPSYEPGYAFKPPRPMPAAGLSARWTGSGWCSGASRRRAARDDEAWTWEVGIFIRSVRSVKKAPLAPLVRKPISRDNTEDNSAYPKKAGCLFLLFI